MAVEILRAAKEVRMAKAILDAIAAHTGGVETRRYKGNSDILVLFGVGHPVHAAARDAHVRSGRKAVLWDLGYIGDRDARFSIDRDHPQHLMDRVPDVARIDVPLREDADPDGPIVLVGMGDKARRYHGAGWEVSKFRELVKRFPGRKIVYRPKRNTDVLMLPCERIEDVKIEEALRGASLVVCRHSNVAIDAVIAGVPFEAEDGAATWMKDFSLETRKEFLRRLSWFQCKPAEIEGAWDLIRKLCA